MKVQRDKRKRETMTGGDDDDLQWKIRDYSGKKIGCKLLIFLILEGHT